MIFKWIPPKIEKKLRAREILVEAELETVIADEDLRHQLYNVWRPTHENPDGLRPTEQIVRALFEKTPESVRITEWRGRFFFGGCCGGAWNETPGLHGLAREAGLTQIADAVFALLAKTNRFGNYTARLYLPTYGTAAEIIGLFQKKNFVDIAQFFTACLHDEGNSRELLLQVPESLWRKEWGGDYERAQDLCLCVLNSMNRAKAFNEDLELDEPCQ